MELVGGRSEGGSGGGECVPVNDGSGHPAHALLSFERRAALALVLGLAPFVAAVGGGGLALLLGLARCCRRGQGLEREKVA